MDKKIYCLFLAALTLIAFISFTKLSGSSVYAYDCGCSPPPGQENQGCTCGVSCGVWCGSCGCTLCGFNCGGGDDSGGGGNGGGRQNPSPAPQPTNTPIPTPTPTPTPIIIPVMGLKVGSLNTGINDGSIVLSWQDLLPVNIRSKAMTSQITYMGVLFSDGLSVNTNSINFNAEKATMETKSSSQKSLIQTIISSFLSIFNPFSF